MPEMRMMRVALVACLAGGCSFASVPTVGKVRNPLHANHCNPGNGPAIADVVGVVAAGVGAFAGYRIATGDITFGDANRGDTYETIGGGIAVTGAVIGVVYAVSAVHGFRQSRRCRALRREFPPRPPQAPEGTPATR